MHDLQSLEIFPGKEYCLDPCCLNGSNIFSMIQCWAPFKNLTQLFSLDTSINYRNKECRQSGLYFFSTSIIFVYFFEICLVHLAVLFPCLYWRRATQIFALLESFDFIFLLFRLSHKWIKNPTDVTYRLCLTDLWQTEIIKWWSQISSLWQTWKTLFQTTTRL